MATKAPSVLNYDSFFVSLEHYWLELDKSASTICFDLEQIHLKEIELSHFKMTI